MWEQRITDSRDERKPDGLSDISQGLFFVGPSHSKGKLLDEAVNSLYSTRPEYSAKHTFGSGQIIFLICMLVAVPVLAIHFQFDFYYWVTIALATFYLSSTLLRVFVLGSFDERINIVPENLDAITDAVLPPYSVLVPLYKEANQIRELCAHLDRMNWPKDRLDIKLICEQDDLETIAAVRSLNLGAHFDLVIVPFSEPRTKPKAMNFALPLCWGDFLVIYDAEDRPSFNQLREAYVRFSSEGGGLACLQAPLAIHNYNQNWLTKLFAIEYATLFNGILPVLAAWRAPLPLGGTSNHFRMSVLRNSGAWDPYNVTEDADLGVRLYREGYRSSTLTLPTWEEAPPNFKPWLTQRTRWMKGWMQTILVHTRTPFALVRELGVNNTCVFHMLLTCILVSGLVHPIFLVLTALLAIDPSQYIGNPQMLSILALSAFNLVCGYLSYMFLAHVVLKTIGMGKFTRMIWMLPVYWLLISLACWRALFQLIFSPHKWEKTPHGLAKDTFSD